VHHPARPKTRAHECACRRSSIANATSGQFVWHDHLAKDPKAAIAFYTEVFGWKTQPFYYIETSDLDAAMGRATKRGAKVMNGPMDVPGGARIVQLMDPQGAGVALYELVKK
jgi:predicted enzyme related to lactoylglutathione lyase